MNLEVKKESTHTFTFPTDVFETLYWQNNEKAAITSATITITGATGDSYLAETNMSIAGDTYSATYSWDSSNADVDYNYIVIFKINGVEYPRFFDIYNYPFQNTVTDNDLFQKDMSLKENCYSYSGKAESGSTVTIVDSNRIEDDDYFNGGIVEIYQENRVEVRKVTDFAKATNTITFDPAVSVAVAEGTGYSLRESFDDLIVEAGKEAQLRFNNIEKRAFLLIDHTQFKEAIIFRCLANYWFHKRKEIDDEYDLKYKYYENMFERVFTNTIWKYDVNADATIGQDEDDQLTGIRWHR